MIETGICLIGYGESGRRESILCVQSIQKHCDYPITLFTDTKIDDLDIEQVISVDSDDEIVDWNKLARQKKLVLINESPYRHTIYMDVDCRVQDSIEPLLEPLLDGYDMVIAPSTVQGARWGQHSTKQDRNETANLLIHTPIQYQCGVFSFRKTPKMKGLFAQWRKEYGKYSDVDQLAFMRALWQKPVKLHVVSNVFNGGVVIKHLFGALKR